MMIQHFLMVQFFTQVIEYEYFSCAAIATGHSNSYISKTVNKLEARIGVCLFIC